GKPEKVTVDELLQIQDDGQGNNTFIYSNSIIQEDYKLFSPFLSGNKDSIEFKKLISKQVTRVIRNDEIEGNKLSAEERFVRVSQMDRLMKELVSNAIKEMTSKLPIYKRIDKERLTELIKDELTKRNINSEFEYGINSKGIATKIQTADLEH